MTMIPRKPKHGDPISVLPGIVGALIDHVRSITPASSADIGVCRLSGGTTYTLKRRPTTTAVASVEAEFTHAWRINCKEIISHDQLMFKVSVASGSAQVLGTGTQYFAAEEFELRLSVDASGEPIGKKIFIEYQLWDSSGVPIEAWVPGIQVADELPQKNTAPKSAIFMLGEIHPRYINNVNQHQFTAIACVVDTIAAQDASTISTMQL